VASAAAVVLLLLLVAPLVFYDRLQRRQMRARGGPRADRLSPFNVASLALGLAFLYRADRDPGVYSSTPRGWSRCGAAGRCAGTPNFSMTRHAEAAWMSFRWRRPRPRSRRCSHTRSGRAIARRGSRAARCFPACSSAPLVMPKSSPAFAAAVVSWR